MREWAGVEGEEQFSYPSYLILSAQMGGSWIERPVPPEHRLTLEIDCIRHYLPLPATTCRAGWWMCDDGTK